VIKELNCCALGWILMCAIMYINVKICLIKYFNYLYRDFLKQQKTMSTELARMSSKGSNEVAGDITLCQKNLQFIEHNLDKQKTSVEKLKYETNKVCK